MYVLTGIRSNVNNAFILKTNTKLSDDIIVCVYRKEKCFFRSFVCFFKKEPSMHPKAKINQFFHTYTHVIQYKREEEKLMGTEYYIIINCCSFISS